MVFKVVKDSEETFQFTVTDELRRKRKRQRLNEGKGFYCKLNRDVGFISVQLFLFIRGWTHVGHAENQSSQTVNRERQVPD